MKTLIALLTLVSLTACASAPKHNVSEMVVISGATLDGKPLEAIYGAAASKTGLRVRVSSNGCTKKEDFQFLLPGLYSGRPSKDQPILFVRKKPDPCQSLVMGSTWLEFSYEELKIAPTTLMTISNPLTAWTGLGD